MEEERPLDIGGATLLITGGTGSFGRTVLKKYIRSDLGQIRIFSRDEKKQDDMRHRLQQLYPDCADKVKFFIGDVRDRESLRDVMHGVDYIFHAAALKQVPSCEFFPMEAVRTNVIGTDNLLHAAMEAGVRKVVCLSTDKAAYPINAMGISKAMMEKVATAKARQLGENACTTICCTRYGNVMASRGSVIPLWVEQMMEGKPITITDPNMTRFMMTLDDVREEGSEEGRAEGAIQEAVKLYNEEMGLSPLQIMKKIMDRFDLNEDDAKSYVEDTLGVKLELEMV